MMTLQEYVDEIKWEVTGGLLELEIPDESIGQAVKKALREVRRYIDSTALITVPYAKCIDLSGFKCSSVVNIYRTSSIGSVADTGGEGYIDPLYVQQQQVYGNFGDMYRLQDYLLNFMAYSTISQMRNTLSTDLDYKYDKNEEKIYITVDNNIPTNITIEYVPAYEDVSEVTSDYWIDIIQRLALAYTKIALGRIRSRYTQSNALWEQDGETMLEEGNTEKKELEEVLRTNSMLFIPKD